MVHVNDDIKATFIHIPKCGGVMTRTMLSKYYNFYYPEKIHHLHFDYISFLDNSSQLKLTEDYDPHTIRKFGKYRYMYSHQYFDKKCLDEYTIFTFVRNPYVKLYSAYAYLKKTLINGNNKKIRNSYENKEYFTDFNTFVKNYQNLNNISYFHGFITQESQLMDFSGNVNIHFIGRCENLNNDLLDILTILDVNEILHTSEIFHDYKLNQSVAADINIANEYNEETFHFVNDYFDMDFHVFKYEKYKTFEEFKTADLYKIPDCNNSFNTLTEIYKERLIINKYIDNAICITNEHSLLIDVLIKKIEELYPEYNKNELDIIKNTKNFYASKIKNIDNRCSLLKNEHKKQIFNRESICRVCGFKSLNELSSYCHSNYCK